MTQRSRSEKGVQVLSADKARLLELLRHQRRGRSEAPGLQPRVFASGPVRMPTTGAQRQLWFLHQLEGGSLAYHIPLAVRMRGSLDRAALLAALKGLVERHEALRTVFVEVDGEPLQDVLPAGQFPLAFFDLEMSTTHDHELELHRHASEELDAPFDLSTGPLIRSRLLRLSRDEYVLLVTMHHLISDGWSIAILIRELGLLYGAHVGGESEVVLHPPAQYAEYAQWQKSWLAGIEAQQQLMYWKERMQGAPELVELPRDRPRPPTQSHRGASRSVVFGQGLTADLRTLARRFGLTLAMVLHAGWSVVLARLSGQPEIVVGIPVANRTRPQDEGAIGFFVNTLPIRVRFAEDMSVAGLLQQVKEVLLGAYSHQSVPFEHIVEVLQPTRALSHSPLFQVMLALQSAKRDATELPGLTLTEEDVPLNTAKFDLVLALQESGTDIIGTLNYATDLFEEATVERWIGHLKTVLAAMVREPQLQVTRLPLMHERECRQLIHTFNSTQSTYPRTEFVHQLFERQVQLAPQAVAAIWESGELTYAELNRRANQLARYLKREQVAVGDYIPIVMSRSLAMLVAQIAVLKCGGVYVPIDPELPIERKVFLIGDCNARHCITDHTSVDDPKLAAVRWISCTKAADLIATQLGVDLQLPIHPVPAAYVMYTSGSTGVPKGVVVPHHAINRLVFNNGYADIGPEDCIAHYSNPAFDASTFEIWGALLSGARLVIVPQRTALDVRLFSDVLMQNRVTVMYMSVGLFNQYAAAMTDVFTQLRYLIVGGDRLEPAVIARVLRNAPPHALLNGYGPTECTTFATTHLIHAIEETTHGIPIGKPIANTKIYILDAHDHVVPIGVVGEIYIGGAGVACGYLNRPELTEQKFLPDRFSTDSQARLYKTGDLGRWRADGVIEFIGRKDHQVKIRGFRVELGEIEAYLVRHAQIKEATLLARSDALSEKTLVAYVVPRDPAMPIDASELRAYLKKELPEYMVPGALVMLERMPLTSTGKVDRNALPAPDVTAYGTRSYEPPQTDMEELLVQVWQGLLRVERVGRHDNFFELGGHSLMIVQMMERLRRLGLAAEVRRVFESPTLADLAGTLTRQTSECLEVPASLIPLGCKAIVPEMLPLVELDAQQIDRIVDCVPGGAGNVQDIYPLAPLQEGILFLHLLNERSNDAYVLPTVFLVASRTKLDALIAALQALVNRHDIFRTAILWEQLPCPVQVVYRQATLPVEEVVLDYSHDAIEQVRAWTRPEHQRMNLRGAPMLRLKVAADPNSEQWYALLQLHHIVVDGQSLGVAISEVVSSLEGRTQQLPQSMPYRNHVAQALAHARAYDAEAFFRSKFGEVDVATAPFGLLDVHGDGTQVEEAREELDLAFADRLRATARRMGISAATMFHASWAMVVAHTSGRDNIIFGTVLLGRLQGTAGAQHGLGMFINTLPLRLTLRDVSAKGLVGATQRELVELLGHEQASLAVAQRCSGIGGNAPLFSALLNYRHGSPNPEASWSSAGGLQVLFSRNWTNYPITLSVDDTGEGFALTAQTDRRIDPYRIVTYLRTALLSLLEALESRPEQPALALAVVPEVEQRKVIELFSGKRSANPKKSIHQLFEEQVLRTPSTVAVKHEKRSLTYSELNVKADRVARQLTSRRVGPNQLIGVCVERSLEMVVGLLGILKAGGAYLPLDPNYPAERLRHMLEDAAPELILTQARVQALLPTTAVQVMLLDAEDVIDVVEDESQLAASPTNAAWLPHNLLYVIYTSGSTGRPKGTAMSHGAMVNLLEWQRSDLPMVEGQPVLQFAALSFDVAFQEIFSTLCGGGTLVLLDEWVRRDAAALTDLLRDQAVERLFVPPLMLQSLAEYCKVANRLPEHLRDVITAGEQLRISPEIVALFSSLDGCRLHNHYGPTETHVVTSLTLSGAAERWPALPTIGRPIANTRIYILNSLRCPVPVDVVGEIYIGGANLARGYLNRPEQTADRFVQDPFAAEPGARMYMTGDLGKWREDGTIEYLGRSDDQVKIRGFRIELGEIDAQLALHESVKEVAVVSREDDIGQRRLVAYVSLRAGHTASIEELRAHVKSALPEHMMPSAFVTLDNLPMTPNGKLNRRALPAPQFESSLGGRYVHPQGEAEEILADIWKDVLRVARVGREDNFFELGGHSLLVLKLLFRINQSFASELKVTDVYKSPTVRELAMSIAGENVEGTAVDLGREAALSKDISAKPGARRTPEKVILLTGATGFVGRFVLAHLLQETDANILCLIRAASAHEAASRLRLSLVKWDLWCEGMEHRITAIAGDLRLPSLGIDATTYQWMSEEVDSIFHCGTSMNHLETYAMAKPANVESARELLKLATNGRPKLVNYLSTLGVFGPAETQALRFVNEQTSTDHERHSTSSGYLASKWVAEKIFMIASQRGIPCNIFRLGLIWADAKRGRYDELQHGYRFLKSCLLSGYGIKDYRYDTVPVPVDYAAGAIVRLADRHRNGRGIFHIASSRRMDEGMFECCNRVAQTSLELLSYYEWTCEMRRLHNEGQSLPAAPLIQSTFSLDEAAFHAQQVAMLSRRVHVDCARTEQELERAVVSRMGAFDDLLRVSVEHMLLNDAGLREMAQNQPDPVLVGHQGEGRFHVRHSF